MEKNINITITCPECGKNFVKHRPYSPTYCAFDAIVCSQKCCYKRALYINRIDPRLKNPESWLLPKETKIRKNISCNNFKEPPLKIIKEKEQNKAETNESKSIIYSYISCMATELMSLFDTTEY